MKNKLGTALRTAFAASALVIASGAQALTLPTVSACSFAPATLLCYDPYGTGVTEIYVASRHDDFISYSVNALSQLANTYDYEGLAEWGNVPSFGSGQIVKLFSFNNSNNVPFPPATDTKDETVNENGPPKPPLPESGDTDPDAGNYLGDWPYIGSVTVGDLEAFLNGSLPVFSFDLNNNTGAPLLLNGVLEVVRNGVVIEELAFDNFFDSEYTEDSLVSAAPEVPVTWFDPNNAACPLGACSMLVKNNIGSGEPDFFAYAPTFDLSKYQNTDTLHFMLKMAGLNAGGEELALVEGINVTNVPEPGVLALIGLALAGLGVTRRFKKNV